MNKLMARVVAPAAMAVGLAAAPIAVSAASAAPALPAYGPTTCSFTVTVTPPTFRRGDHFSVTISGNCDGVTFTIQIHSTPETVGTMTTDGSGNSTASFVAPTDLPDGPHSVIAISSVGSSQSAPVVVSGGPYTGAATPSSATPSSATPSSSLPLTGSNATEVAGVGAAAILVGGGLVLTVRKRRKASNFS